LVEPEALYVRLKIDKMCTDVVGFVAKWSIVRNVWSEQCSGSFVKAITSKTARHTKK
jgi:hypothetical protein